MEDDCDIIIIGAGIAGTACALRCARAGLSVLLLERAEIPGSKNLPLQTIDKVDSIVENKDTALYVYCHSGARSRQAVSYLQHMGYTNVNNIGGIAAYSGKVE